eukprot:scaffold5096_cov169-Amphora_coffeaeformis.AAC.10
MGSVTEFCHSSRHSPSEAHLTLPQQQQRRQTSARIRDSNYPVTNNSSPRRLMASKIISSPMRPRGYVFVVLMLLFLVVVPVQSQATPSASPTVSPH